MDNGVLFILDLMIWISMVFGRVSDIQTTYSSQFGSLGIIGLYPWTIVQIGLFYFEQFFRPKPQIYQYYTSSIYYKKQIF